jgi:hypothetical protein
MGVPRSWPLILILPAAALAVALLTRGMRRMSLRAQFMVLVVLGVAIGFTFLMMVQLPTFPPWLGVSLVAIVVAASPFAVRRFVRSVMQEDEQQSKEFPAQPP